MGSRAMNAATIQKIRNISPTVKQMLVHVHNKELTFKPGQWVDFFIPHISATGGYSMCSTPSTFRDTQTLELAVKYSTHPPAHWVHNKCVEGDEVTMQVGGSFFYERTRENLRDNLLLIAAGVGINPLLSIMKQINESHHSITAQSNDTTTFGKTLLFYTATTCDELIFKDDISAIADEDSSFKIHYFATREPTNTPLPDDVMGRRMSVSDIEHGLVANGVDVSDVITYMCAPEPMMKEMDDALTAMGVHKKNIRYESWW